MDFDESDFVWQDEVSREDKGRGKRSSKSESANYLLNFNYQTNKPREHYTRRSKPTKIIPFRKERFLHANYKFTIWGEAPDLEPDENFDWNQVVEVEGMTTEPYSCPICLEKPIAAQLSECGHVFCWPCLLRHAGGRNVVPCPLCWVHLTLKECRSVRLRLLPRLKVSQTISFQLLKRPKTSYIASPRSHSSTNFRLIRGTWNVKDITQREERELEKAKKEVLEDDMGPFVTPERQEEEKASTISFIDWALELLQEKKKKFSPFVEFKPLKEEEEEERTPPSPVIIEDPPEELEVEELSWDTPGKFESSKSSTAEESPSMSNGSQHTQVEDKLSSNSTSSNGHQRGRIENKSSSGPMLSVGSPTNSSHAVEDLHESENFYFYQVKDGRFFFLHPLTFRILLAEFHTPERLPDKISGRLVEIEEFTLTEQLRKRYKAVVGHLPLSSSISFLEVDVKKLVSRATMKMFAEEVNKRAKKRKQILRREKEELRKQEIAAEGRRRNILNTSENFPTSFPDVHVEAFEEIPPEILQETQETQEIPQETVGAPSPEVARSASPPSRPQGPSFLEAAKQPPSLINASTPVKKSKSKGTQYVILSNTHRRRM